MNLYTKQRYDSKIAYVFDIYQVKQNTLTRNDRLLFGFTVRCTLKFPNISIETALDNAGCRLGKFLAPGTR